MKCPDVRYHQQIAHAAIASLCLLVLAGPTSSAPGSGKGSAFPDSGFADNVKTAVIGEAVTGLTLNRSTLLNDVIYAISSRARERLLIGFDLRTEEVVLEIEVPTRGSTAWQMGSAGGKVFFALNTDEFFEYDVATETLSEVPETPRNLYSYDMAVTADGKVFITSGNPGVIYEYLVESREFSSITWEDEPPNYPASIAAGADTLFVGTSALYAAGGEPRPAELFAIDRASGKARSILPNEEALVGPNLIETSSSEDWVVTSPGISPPAALLVMNTRDYGSWQIVQSDDENFFDRTLIIGDMVYTTGTSTGTLYEYDIHNDELNALAVPVASAPTRDLYKREGAIVGVSAAGIIWTYDLADAEVRHFDLVELGARGSAQTVQSFSADTTTAVIGGSNRLGVHDLREPYTYRNVVAGGEAKAMTSAGGFTYIGMYPYGALLRHEPNAETPDRLVDFPPGYNRPLDMTFSKHLESVVTTVGRDFDGDGGLSLYNPETRQHDFHERPLGDARPLAVATHRHMIFVGGNDGTITAIDGRSGEALWLEHPIEHQIIGLAADHEYIYGSNNAGEFFQVSASDGALVNVIPDAIGGRPGKIAINHNHIFAVSTEQLVSWNPESNATEVLLDSLDANAYSRNSFPVDENGAMYVIKGTDLVRVKITGPSD